MGRGNRLREMIWFLRIASGLVLASMLAVTTWASLDTAIWAIPPEVTSHPWFVASLFDAYFGFLMFFVWVAYRENSNLRRGLWLIAILLLGNIAMAVYALIQLSKLPSDAAVEELFVGRKAGA